MKIIISLESITRPIVDAVVNPANSFGFMGGGVAKVLKELGGEQIEEEAIESSPTEIGEALATSAGDLKAGMVIHAPTMRNPAQKTDSSCVEQATLAALEKADELKCKKIAFPGMGTGTGQVPVDEAAEAMIKALKNFKPKSLEEVYLVDIEKKMIDAWTSILEGS